MKYWNREIECMPEEKLKNIQDEKLREMVQRVYLSVPFYNKKMKELGIVPEDIKSTEDLDKLSFTYKQDLRDNYPFGMFAVPMSDIVRIHATSGTTGKQTVVGYTKKDIDTWSEVMARTLTCAGADNNSFIHIAYGYGLFTGGLGVHYGAEKIGATVIPVSGGNTSRQLQIMKDFGSTILACTPSYAMYLSEEMENAGIDKKDLKLKAGVFGAEPWSESMRAEIEERFGILAIDIYGLSEIMGPGVASECECKCGLHIASDHFIPEIIDPETQKVLPPGSIGELVFTTVSKEGLPLIRYRTRDISSLDYSRCDCGRTSVRMSKVLGRTDDMIIIRGVNVFPSQIESVLLGFGGTTPNYLMIVERKDNLDVLEVDVEMTQELFSDKVKEIENIENRIRREILNILGINANVRLVEPRSIARSEGKAKRVIDKRNI